MNLNFIKGLNGEVELIRAAGALGVVAFIGVACGLTLYEVLLMGKDFDIQTFCLTFPPGLTVIAGGTAGSVAIKDRNVATAKVVAETNSQPAVPPAPAPTPDPVAADELPPAMR